MATKFKTTNNQLKQMVRDCANQLLKANNTVTTLEIKTALRKQYPHIHWIQNTKGSVKGISEWMSELSSEGNYDWQDLGTYKMYSAKGGSSKKSTPVKVAASKTPPVNAFVTASKKPAARPRKNSVSASQAVNLIKSAGGRFFTVEFIEKKDGSRRKMNCVLYPGQTLVSNIKNIKVRETTKAKYTPYDAIRSFDPKTLVSLKVMGKTYNVR